MIRLYQFLSPSPHVTGTQLERHCGKLCQCQRHGDETGECVGECHHEEEADAEGLEQHLLLPLADRLLKASLHLFRALVQLNHDRGVDSDECHAHPDRVPEAEPVVDGHGALAQINLEDVDRVVGVVHRRQVDGSRHTRL